MMRESMVRWPLALAAIVSLATQVAAADPSPDKTKPSATAAKKAKTAAPKPPLSTGGNDSGSLSQLDVRCSYEVDVAGVDKSYRVARAWVDLDRVTQAPVEAWVAFESEVGWTEQVFRSPDRFTVTRRACSPQAGSFATMSQFVASLGKPGPSADPVPKGLIIGGSDRNGLVLTSSTVSGNTLSIRLRGASATRNFTAAWRCQDKWPDTTYRQIQHATLQSLTTGSMSSDWVLGYLIVPMDTKCKVIWLEITTGVANMTFGRQIINVNLDPSNFGK